MANDIFQNDEGTVIQLDCGVDAPLGSATVKRIEYTKPDGTEGYWNAVVYNTQYLRYTTVTGDLNKIGDWKVQAYIETSGGKWHGEIARFTVQKSLNT